MRRTNTIKLKLMARMHYSKSRAPNKFNKHIDLTKFKLWNAKNAIKKNELTHEVDKNVFNGQTSTTKLQVGNIVTQAKSSNWTTCSHWAPTNIINRRRNKPKRASINRSHFRRRCIQAKMIEQSDQFRCCLTECPMAVCVDTGNKQMNAIEQN